MAPKKKGGGGYRDDARQFLASLGVRGAFTDLVRRAVVQEWSTEEFAAHLIQTRVFRRRYPGLVVDGALHPDFTGGLGFSAQNLITATARYDAGYDDFQNVASRLGIKAPNRRMFGAAVRGDISLDEFGVRAQALKTVKANPDLLDAFNEELRLQGEKPLDRVGLLKFATGTAAPKFYDTYQAAVLRRAGLDLNARSALDTARALDSGLQPNMNLGDIISQVRQMKAAGAPEIAALGISDSDLVLLGAGSDPKGLAEKLQQIVANRQAMGQQTQGVYAQQGTGGGPALYPAEPADNY